MYRRYTTLSGKHLNCWYNALGGIEVLNKSGNEIARYEFDSKDADPTFTHDGEVIHINDFDFYGVDELIQRLEASKNPKTEEDRRFIFRQYFLETLLRDTENVGIVGEFECYNTLIPEFGMGLKGSGSSMVKCLMVPVERHYKKEDWHYKVEFTPEDDKLKLLVGTETWYLEDLASMLHQGIYQLVNRVKYREIFPVEDVDTTKVKCTIF